MSGSDEVDEGQWEGNQLQGYGIQWDREGKRTKCGKFEQNKLIHSCAVPRSALPVDSNKLTEQEKTAALLYPNGDYYIGELDENNEPHDSNGKLYSSSNQLIHTGNWIKGQQSIAHTAVALVPASPSSSSASSSSSSSSVSVNSIGTVGLHFLPSATQSDDEHTETTVEPLPSTVSVEISSDAEDRPVDWILLPSSFTSPSISSRILLQSLLPSLSPASLSRIRWLLYKRDSWFSWWITFSYVIAAVFGALSILSVDNPHTQWFGYLTLAVLPSLLARYAFLNSDLSCHLLKQFETCFLLAQVFGFILSMGVLVQWGGDKMAFIIVTGLTYPLVILSDAQLRVQTASKQVSNRRLFVQFCGILVSCIIALSLLLNRVSLSSTSSSRMLSFPGGYSFDSQDFALNRIVTLALFITKHTIQTVRYPHELMLITTQITIEAKQLQQIQI